ncbi:MAG: phosphoribosylformylglycinamidine synthase subunit PurQ [Desulfobacterales bacterium]|nr:phosphoribosylformylglycinamidine synthase subunit PurQ [Desulfobacterales bacterium]MDX2512542.1 phosphoribosylformylglycinamidine synthase subunit PurQ [Desulfobacterales bacterium]
MKAVNVLVLTGYGLNCDNETAYAFELAGASAQRVHINALIAGAVSLSDFQILVFGGGFSWGDDHGAGVIQAVRMKTSIGRELFGFIEKGNLVMGICNGFQTLVNLGLLPGFDLTGRQPENAQRSVAVTFNDCGNFRDQWVNMRVNTESPCVYTRGLTDLELPVRHGEGKFFTDIETLKRLTDNQQVALRYALPDGRPADQAFPCNPNGSIDDIAGICDPTGRIFGLMPHPEAYNHWTNHPDWPLMKEKRKRKGEPLPSGLTPGLKMLANGVEYFKQ